MYAIRSYYEHAVALVEGGFDISLKSDKLAKNLFMTIGDEEGFFSDNYFDLLPREEVTVHLKTTISADKLAEVLKIQTLDEAF